MRSAAVCGPVAVVAPLDVAATRVLLFNALAARQSGGTLWLRVDDSRDDARAAQTLADDLGWLEFTASAHRLETSGRQSAYLAAAQRLVRDGHAARSGGAVELRLPAGSTVIHDAVKGAVSFDNGQFGDAILVDTNGGVNRVFAAAVDAADVGATFIVREDRELEHSALEALILAALGVPPPQTAHIGVLLPQAGALPTIARLRGEGIVSAALVNHLALLGWSPGTVQESFSFDELVATFSLDRLGHAPAHFNEPRLYAFNARALRALAPETLAAQLMAAMQRAGLLETPVPAAARRWVDTFLAAYADSFASLTQALQIIAELRAEAIIVPALELERLRNRQVVFYLDAVGQYVDAQPELRGLPLEHDLPAIAEEFGIAHADAFATVRMALTGKADGAPLSLLFPLLGHDRILIRIGAISSHLLHGRGLEPITYGPGGVPFETIKAQRPPAPDA